jgi:putative cell wall-binding protein/5-hydroxyisourate hydrolase-like protein (transthyretin family)
MNDAGKGRRTRGMLWLVVMLAVMLAVTAAALADTDPIIATGRVTDAATGEPIAGVVVQVGHEDSPPLAETITGADGTYTLVDLHGTGAGWYEFRLLAVGYRICWSDVYWDGVTPLPLDEQLYPADAIATGRVTDASTGEGIGGAIVSALWYSLSGPWHSSAGDAVTDADGNYVLYSSWGDGEGEYRFKVTASGYHTQEHVEIWDGLAPLADVDFALSPMVFAEGTVTDAVTEAGIEGVWVDAQFHDGDYYQWAGSAQTDEHGAYTLYLEHDYGHGEYMLSVSAEGYIAQGRFEMWEGSTLLDIDFALDPAPVIATGRVTDGVTGHGVGDAYVVFLWFDGGYWDFGGAAFTDESGEYVLYDYYGLAAGDYRFYAGVYPGYHDSATVDRTWDGTNPLVLDFEIEPLVLAQGTVVDATTSVGIDEAWVEAEWYDENEESWVWAGFSWTAEDGSYTLHDQSRHGGGEYRFTAGTRGYTRQAKQLTWDGWNPLTVNFALQAADVIATGAVTDVSTGGPLSNAMVEAEFYDGEEWVSAAADITEDGAYVLYDHWSRGAATYRFRASAGGYHGSGAISRSWNGTTPLVLDFELYPEDAIVLATGTVTDASDGEPIEGARVLVWSYSPFEFLGTAHTDEHGFYTFYLSGDYGAGDYLVSSRAHGYRNSIGFLRTWDGETPLDLSFSLQPADMFATGTVTDASTGEGIPNASVYALWFDSADGRWIWADASETDENGAYTLYDSWGHGAGEHRFWATAEGYVDSDDHYRSWDGLTPFTVDFELDPRPVIATGTVTDATNGQPIDGARVTAYQNNGDYLVKAGEAYTDEKGEYTFFDVHGYGAGEYEFIVFAVGYQVRWAFEYWDGGDPLIVDIGLEPALPPPSSISIEGTTRFDTAVAASLEAYPDGAETVIIATGRNWPDALGGTALAGALDAPILLSEPTSLPAVTKTEIERLEATHAIILGGTGAVSKDVADTLVSMGLGVERIFGDDRYQTAEAVAARTISVLGGSFDGTVFVATGANFPDALAAAPLAASQGWPLLLAHPTGGLSAASATLISTHAERALILGGTGAVSPAVESSLDTLLGGAANTTRLQGLNRYVTAVAIASYGVTEAGHTWDRVGIATGEDYPDALAGGVLQGKVGSVMVLTLPTSLHSATATALETNAGAIDTVTFFGGTGAVSTAVRDAALAAAGIIP